MFNSSFSIACCISIISSILISFCIKCNPSWWKTFIEAISPSSIRFIMFSSIVQASLLSVAALVSLSHNLLISSICCRTLGSPCFACWIKAFALASSAVKPFSWNSFIVFDISSAVLSHLSFLKNFWKYSLACFLSLNLLNFLPLKVPSLLSFMYCANDASFKYWDL